MPTVLIYLYDGNMNITLTPEIQSLIKSHLAHGCGETPEAVLLKALHALQEAENLKENDAHEHLPEHASATVSHARHSQEAIQALARKGILRRSGGGKPQGVSGVKVHGESMSSTVLNARR